MKKLIGSLLLLLVIGGISSCRNDLDPIEDGHHRIPKEKDKPVMKTVRMSFGGDFITESEEPLLRAEDGDGRTFIGINVWRTEKDKEGATREKYAYGLFDNLQDLLIDLYTGYTYKFQATILIEREHTLWNMGKNSGKGQYQEPFMNSNKSDFYETDMNEFHYTNVSFTQLNSGTAMVDAGDDLASRYGNVSFPRVKRFYGDLTSFDPGISDNVEIKMAYKSFGIRFEIASLPAGYVTVSDITALDANRFKEAHQRLTFTKDLKLSNDGVSYWDGLFSMNDFDVESETFNLRFTWHKGGNATETFEKEVTVKPGNKKILKLNINGDPNYKVDGNISFIMETETLSEESEIVNEKFE